MTQMDLPEQCVLSEENSQVSYSIEFPVTCKGKNIDKITYDIKDAVFK
ncbi:MAG: hypothetical protein ACLUR5_11060 [Eubacterium ventriosum]